MERDTEIIYMAMTEEQTRHYFSADAKEAEKTIWELARTAQQIANKERKPVRIYTCAIPVSEMQPMTQATQQVPTQPDKPA